MKLLSRSENIFNDNIGYVENWDFSKSNMNDKKRVEAITTVASICYQNPKAIGSESLYNRLLGESKGLPSSSFEFVPVLLSEEVYKKEVESKLVSTYINNPLTKYGEWIIDDNKNYLLTNYRAVVYTKENYPKIDLTKHYNTEDECKIISKYFKVFKFKVDMPTRTQMIRHRISWQELSRRYVSGNKVPFEFYVSEKMKNVVSVSNDYFAQNTEDINKVCLEHYNEAIKIGIKPQEARRIITQMAYTEIWGVFMPTQLNNYFKLRLDEHAQWEIKQTAIAMQKAIN